LSSSTWACAWVFAGFVHKQRLFVPAQRHTVGKTQAAGDQARRFGGRVIFQNAAGAGLLQDVEHAGLEGAAPVFGCEAGGCIAEIHLAVFGDNHCIRIADRVSVHCISEHGDLRIRRDGEQPFDSIRCNQVALRIKVKAQHPAAGVGKYMLRAPIGLHAQDVAARHGGVELAVAAELDVLRAHLALQVNHLQVAKPCVNCVRAGVARSSGSIPNHGADGYRPQQQVQQHQARGGGNECSNFIQGVSPVQERLF
jgi:hypothetical protein